MAGGSLISDLEEEYGKNFLVQLSGVSPLKLKGVPYAARMSARYICSQGASKGTRLDLCLCRALPDIHLLSRSWVDPGEGQDYN